MKVQALFEEELEDYVKRLTKKELMKKLGSGVYGAVFQHPTYHNMVVKVFEGGDEGYKTWLKFAKRNQNNKYVPKIVSIHYVENEYGDEIGLVFMKKLLRAPVAKIRVLVKTLNDALKSQRSIADHNYHFEEFSGTDWFKISKAVAKSDPDLAKIALLFSDVPPSDLHDANLMMDTDGQLVITDPFGF